MVRSWSVEIAALAAVRTPFSRRMPRITSQMALYRMLHGDDFP